MDTIRKVIVTGCNKGIGFAIVDSLASKPWKIIMACRNVSLAQQASKKIKQKNPAADLAIQELDVSNSESISNFVKKVQKYGKIDILLNNAGVAAKGDEFDSEVVRWTFATNYYGTIQLTKKMIPHIQENGKIIIVGSMVGKYSSIKNEQLRDRFKKADSQQALNGLMKQFQTAVEKGDYLQKGWPKWGYAISKVGINNYARILAKNPEILVRGLQVYALCPGYVSTDMTSFKGYLKIQQGALTPVYLCELPFKIDPALQGGFFQKSGLSAL